MEIRDFLAPENVIPDLAAGSKTRLLQAMAGRASQFLGIDEKPVTASLLAREKLGSTGLGDGIAIPHTRVPGLHAPLGMLARLQKAIDFDAIDDVAVDIVFLLLTPADTANDQLNVLACAARRLRLQEVTAGIRAAATADQIFRAMVAPNPAT